jgi:pentatricopeptide repeat protein
MCTSASANQRHSCSTHRDCAQDARRQQLVLADRAFGLLDVLWRSGRRPDLATWNALIQCAGFSGQLDRAFAMLNEMASAGCKPNPRTFAVLLTACAGVRPHLLPIFLSSHSIRPFLHSSPIISGIEEP